MISNPSLIIYACVAKGSTILTEFSPSIEPGIETIAQRCIEKTPPNHSIFCHTILKKSYTFLINDPFAYFVISHDNLEKSEALWFLNHAKSTFEEFMVSKRCDKLAPLCFQAQFNPLFRDMLGLDVDSSLVDSTGSRNRHLGGRRSVEKPSDFMPTKTSGMLKKKGSFGEGNDDPHHGKNGDDAGANRSRELSVRMMHKGGSGGFYFGDNKQKAKQIWKKHVLVVLILDVVICIVLFCVWLLVCRGFKCIVD